MSSGSMRMAVLMPAFALTLAGCHTPPATQIAASNRVAAPEPSSSMLDVPIEDIAASPGGRAILDRDFPGLCTQSMYEYFKAMSLNQIAALSRGRIDPGMLAQAQTDLAALPARPVAQRIPQTDADDLNLPPSGAQASLSDSYPK
jgi:hypothetical protein